MKKPILNSIAHILLVCTLIFATGCLRGETKTLTEVFEISRQNFLNEFKQNSELPQNVNTSISSLNTLLEDLTKNGSASSTLLSSIEQNLSTLLPHATYTVRPALTELRNQFLEASKDQSLTDAQAKLLASRVYNVISEELKQSKFQVN